MNTITIPVRKNGPAAAHTERPARPPVAGTSPTTRHTVTPTPDAIRSRAWEIYQARVQSGLWGDDRSDWLQAERELNGSTAQPTLTGQNLPPANPARGEVLLHGDA